MGDTDRLDALLTAYELKDETRTGWDQRGVRDPESVAAHSWGVVLLCELLGPEADVDVAHAVRLALVHDLAEAVTGDVPHPEADAAAKAAREREVMADFDAILDAELVARWEEYEHRETPEARFLADMDRLDMCIQALYYERHGRTDDDLAAFFESADSRFRTAVGRAAFAAVRERFERERR